MGTCLLLTFPCTLSLSPAAPDPERVFTVCVQCPSRARHLVVSLVHPHLPWPGSDSLFTCSYLPLPESPPATLPGCQAAGRPASHMLSTCPALALTEPECPLFCLCHTLLLPAHIPVPLPCQARRSRIPKPRRVAFPQRRFVPQWSDLLWPSNFLLTKWESKSLLTSRKQRWG